MPTEQFLSFRSADEFQAYLMDFINVSRWGENGAKSPGELWAELRDGDSGLIRLENGLLRLTWPLFINVIYQNKSILYNAYETASKKGKYRNLPGTFAEKRHANEDIIYALNRTFTEEINLSLPQSGLSLEDSHLSLQREWEENTSARSYPGLQTLSVNTLYDLELSPDQGIPKPFNLVEKGGTSKFDWQVIQKA